MRKNGKEGSESAAVLTWSTESTTVRGHGGTDAGDGRDDAHTPSIGRRAKRALKCLVFSVKGIGDGRNGRCSSKNEREKRKGSKTEPLWFPKASNESPNQSSQLIEPGDRPWSAGNSTSLAAMGPTGSAKTALYGYARNGGR